MKTDRLLSIIIYLLNRDLVSARELAEKFEVSVRTIQRDMEAIELAGIPIMTIQGPSGGYSIMENFTLDRQFVGMEDLFFIITALGSLDASVPAGNISSTIEKMKTLVTGPGAQEIESREERLFMDFSAFGGSVKQQEVYKQLDDAVSKELLVEFEYTSNRFETTRRVVEPMALAFKWRSWYLIGFCRLRNDFRMFRLGRIRGLTVQNRHFRRKDFYVRKFIDTAKEFGTDQDWITLRLRFDKQMRHLVEEFFPAEGLTTESEGSLLVETRLPETGWVYGLILSYGHFVEVLEPDHIRQEIRESARKILAKYD
ncbi:MAG: helix-turn-helix transcriptional regulator [Spirochaetia bacterium]